MDERRFDELTKALVAAKPSRREALRRLAGGALATVFGGLALKEVSAQEVGTEAYNLVCKQEGAKFICTEGTPANEVTSCKSLASGCVCARKKGGGQVCVQQPSSGCPTRRNKCKEARDCASGETCILVSGCCDGSSRGKCVRKCPE